MKKKYQSSTIQRAVDILELFKKHDRLTFSEMQHCLGYHKSTLFRVLSTLESNKYIHKNNQGFYELGISIFILGHRISREHQLKTVAGKHMQILTDQINLTVHLGIIEGIDIVIIEKAEPLSRIKMVSRIGGTVPAHCTGQGKTLLAFSAPEIVAKIIDSQGLHRFTHHTICRADALHTELKKIRIQGYAIDNSEHEEHIRCVAAPIIGEDGNLIAALSITGTIMDIPDEKAIQKLLRALLETANAIRRELGHATQAPA